MKVCGITVQFFTVFSQHIFCQMKAVYTIALLLISNIFMTVAWYGHLRLKEYAWFANFGLWKVILFSWAIALLEYTAQVPANKIGYEGNGGPFTLWQLKVIQEILTLLVFTGFTVFAFKNETLRWNHLVAFLFLVLAVYFIFKK